MNLQEWLGDNELGIDIWKKKYQYENETFEEWLDRISGGDLELKQLIKDKKFLFGGRILANRGLDKKGKKITLSNCYVIPEVEDSIESIYNTCSKLARTFSYSGGVGVDISKLRPKGMRVNNASEETTGACSFMDTFSQVTATIGARGRRGALMLSIECTHPDLEEFISIKNDLDKVTKANISVRVSDEFMQAVIDDKDWELYFKTEYEEMRKIVRAKEIFRLLCKNNWNYAEPGILFWDNIESNHLLSEDKNFKYAGVNPCAEEPLPAGGSCLLGTINLSEYVKEDKTFDSLNFKFDIHTIVNGMNDVLDEGLPLHPLQIQRDAVRDYRQIGIGVMGIADMLIKMGIKYDSDEAIKLCDEIASELADTGIQASALLAKEKGVYLKYKDTIKNSKFFDKNTTSKTKDIVSKYGLRNSQIFTIAPCGSISTMIGVSGGIEPIFANSYTRKTESLHGEDKYYKVYTPIVKDYMKKNGLTEEEQLPNFFVTAQNINPIKRIEMQGVWQSHIDASISSTLNLPNEATIEDVERYYIHAWEKGLKGMTIYRDGCARSGVLTTSDKKENKEIEVVGTLKRGEWKSLAEDTYYVKRSLKIGCGSLKLFIGYSPSEKTIQDIYVVKTSSGGCEKNLQTIAITMSAIFRLGGSVENIEHALSGVGTCPSFTSARTKGEKLSKGNYCGMAILNEIKVFLNEVNNYKEIIYSEFTSHTDLKRKLPKAIPIQCSGECSSCKNKCDNIPKGKKCPECRERTLTSQGGCDICTNCGFTHCG